MGLKLGCCESLPEGANVSAGEERPQHLAESHGARRIPNFAPVKLSLFSSEYANELT